MTTRVYSVGAREGAGAILWGDAELLDRQADAIETFRMTSEQAADYLRDLAKTYRQAASAATAGRDSL